MKRIFTDANIYDDEWYQEMSIEHKLFWDYICRRCEHGVWKPNFSLAEFQLKISIEPDVALKAFNSESGNKKERVIVLENGRWFLTSWISFQYPTLSRDCPAHKPVFNFYERSYPYLMDRYLVGIYTLQEIDKEKKKRGIVKGGRPTCAEVRAYFAEKSLSKQEADRFFDYYESVGWVVGRTHKPMKNWRGAVGTWMRNVKEWGKPEGRDFSKDNEDFEKGLERRKKESVPPPPDFKNEWKRKKTEKMKIGHKEEILGTVKQ